MRKKQTHIVYGLVTVVVMIIVGTALMHEGMAFKPGLAEVVNIPFVAGIILNAVAFSKANNGYITFGDAFLSCFKATVVIMIVRIAWIPVSGYLFPDIKEKMFAMFQGKMSANPAMTDEGIGRIIGFIKNFWGVILVTGTIITTLFYGAIFSVIGGAVAKKNVMPVGDNF